MPKGILSARPGSPKPADFILALLITAAALVVRAALETIAPGIAYLVILLPAVAIAGVFCGTWPAVCVALVGAALIEAVFLPRAIMAWPPFNTAQVDIIAFVPACAAVLWSTATLRRSAAKTAAAEARLMEVFRQIPGAAAILEAPDGRLLLRSIRSDIVLAQPERAVGHSGDLDAYGGIHADGRAFSAGDYPIVRALRGAEVVSGEHVRFRRADGAVADLEVHAGPVLGPDGRVLAAVGMAFDVTERMRSDQRLRDSEARYRTAAERLQAAIDAASLGLWEFYPEAGTVQLDASAAIMFGLARAPITITSDELLRCIDPDQQALAASALAGGKEPAPKGASEGALNQGHDIRVCAAHGDERWFVMRGALLADTRKVVGVIRDVTDRRRREAALEAAIAERELLMREADHRIKNSLQLVTSLLRLQLGRVDDPDTRAALEAAMTRVAAIADAHLALQRSPDLRSLEIDHVLRNLCHSIGLLNPEITVTCNAAVGLWLDAELAIPLGLIASELLTNALRHAFLPQTRGAVILTASSEAGALVMAVRDQGRGLPEGATQSGLGTTVIKALVRQIGAVIETSSRPGQGVAVTLTVRLPSVKDVRQDARVMLPGD